MIQNNLNNVLVHVYVQNQCKMLGMSFFIKKIQNKFFLHCCQHHSLMIPTERATSLVTEEIILLFRLHTEIHHQIVLMPNFFSKSETFQKFFIVSLLPCERITQEALGSGGK